MCFIDGKSKSALSELNCRCCWPAAPFFFFVSFFSWLTPNAQIKILSLVKDEVVLLNYQSFQSVWGKKMLVVKKQSFLMSALLIWTSWSLVCCGVWYSLRMCHCAVHSAPPLTFFFSFFFGTFWSQLVPPGCRCHHIGSCLQTCNASQPWKKAREK